MARVKLENITQKFTNFIAIDQINFEIPDGEFWVLVGPSGCGKSTILRTIAGLQPVTEGKLYIGDTLVNSIPARQRDIAMVFQNYALYPHLTVANNMAFGLKMRNIDKLTINKKIENVARLLSIEHLLNRFPRQLSGGQQQRVALGRAIAREPKAFLLDEPLSNLDAQLRDETRAELKQLHARLGITTIYVTHDQVEAMTLADQIVVLDQGKIQQIGEPQSIYAQPANRMVATFLGQPPTNIFPATYIDGAFVIDNQQLLTVTNRIKKIIQPTNGQSFDIGIRSEYIQISSSDNLAQETKSNCAYLSVIVNLVEPLGREILVRCNLINSNLMLYFNAPPSWQGDRCQQLQLNLDLDYLLVFDPHTGKSLL